MSNNQDSSNVDLTIYDDQKVPYESTGIINNQINRRQSMKEDDKHVPHACAIMALFLIIMFIMRYTANYEWDVSVGIAFIITLCMECMYSAYYICKKCKRNN